MPADIITALAILSNEILRNEYFHFTVILVAAILLAGFIHTLLNVYGKRLVKKTKTDVDDILLGIIVEPLYIYLILGGLYLALRTLSYFQTNAAWLDGFFFVVTVLFSARLLSKVIGVFVPRWLKVKKKYEKTPKLINKIISIVIFLIAFLMILGYYRIEITPIIATLGIGGLAVGLALQNTLSNFFAGLHIVSDRPVSVGDYIELEEEIKGTVEDIGWRSTRIRTIPNKIVIVPNSKLAESTIINDSLPVPATICRIPCGVSYNSDLEKVEKVTVDVAKKIQKTVPGAVKNFEPFIRFKEFGDSNINFFVSLQVQAYTERYEVVHEFIKALKKRYDQEKIEISWPVRKVYNAGKVKG